MIKRISCLLICIVIVFMMVAIAYADNRNLTVYITFSGKKYHTASCEHTKDKRQLAITLEEAVFVGYSPCKTCKPAEADFSAVGWPDYGVLPNSSGGLFDWWQPAA